MKLGILKADALKPELASQFGEYPDMFAWRFQAIAPSIELVTYDVQLGQYPKSIDEVDAYLITGSKSSVYDQELWIDELKKFVIKLHQSKKKLIGICFGHQLVAQALGGQTLKSDAGWCVGVHRPKLSKRAKDLGFTNANKNHFNLISSHQDQVQKLAVDAEVIASTDACLNYMTVLGQHIFTVQGHPEFDVDFARQLLTMRRNTLGESLYEQAVESLQVEADNLLVTRWMVQFLYG